VEAVLTTEQSPAAVLRRAAERDTEPAPDARILDPADPVDRAALLELASHVRVVDTVAAQLDELVRSRVPDRPLAADDVRARVGALLADTPPELFGTWVHQPWADRVVHVLPAALHRELRLDRNRYKITEAEQERLLGLTIAVAGLSVGRSVAGTLVREGVGGELRLADFDTLGLSNLNRVPGGVADLGVNKAVLAAREIVELDPYVRVVTHTDGVRPETVDAFLAGADLVLDECDDLEVKLLLRERARAAGVPVVMVTSERGMLDVERFDTEPHREPFHGLLAGVRAADLRGLSTREKVPYVLRIVDAARLGPRGAASLVEVRSSLSTWPQLASDVVLGGAMATNAVRRIALGELAESGRYEVDLDALVADGRALPLQRPTPPPRALTPDLPALPPPGDGLRPSDAELRFVAACATLAPSGGNAQPWRFTAADGCLAADLDPARTGSMLDFRGRASLLALGAAREAAVIGATAAGFTADPVDGAVWRLRLRRTHPADPRPSSERCWPDTAGATRGRPGRSRRRPAARSPTPRVG
jgi:tRNA A37 threonylcarbamoyladenosine dehydratase